MEVGGTLQFTATGTFATGVNVIAPTWSSSDTSIAQISTAGLAIGIAPGTVTITATNLTSSLPAAATLTVVGRGVMTISITIPPTGEEITVANEAVANATGGGL